jgi:hypothetical protein
MAVSWPGTAPAGRALAGQPLIFTIAGGEEWRTVSQPGDRVIATAARLDAAGLATLPDGSVVVADYGGNRVRRVAQDGTIMTVAGTGTEGDRGDGGPATAADLDGPRDVAVLPDGGILIAENDDVREAAPDGTITTVAGGGRETADGVPATAADLDDPDAVAPLPGGGFLIADGLADKIRRVSPDGTITTVAGTGMEETPPADGAPATAADVPSPEDVAVLPDGSLLVADWYAVHRVWPDGTITTFAHIRSADGLAVTPDGKVLVVGRRRVRLITGDGSTTTIAGTGSVNGPLGDGGAADAATVAASAVAVLPGGGIVLSDRGSVRVVGPPPPPFPALAFREADQASANRYSTMLTLARPGTLTVQVLRGAATVVQQQLNVVSAGDLRVTVRHRFTPGLYIVTAAERMSDGTVAMHSRAVVLSGRLLTRWAVRLSDGDKRTRIAAGASRDGGAADFDVTIRARVCHRFSRTRVDCQMQETTIDDTWCKRIVATELEPNGQISQLAYPCPTRSRPRRFKLHPAWYHATDRIDLVSHRALLAPR